MLLAELGHSQIQNRPLTKNPVRMAFPDGAEVFGVDALEASNGTVINLAGWEQSRDLAIYRDLPFLAAKAAYCFCSG